MFIVGLLAILAICLMIVGMITWGLVWVVLNLVSGIVHLIQEPFRRRRIEKTKKQVDTLIRIQKLKRYYDDEHQKWYQETILNGES